MKRTTPHSDVVRLIRFAAILWIGYLVVLVIINQTLWSPPPPFPGRGDTTATLRGDIVYYAVVGFVALLCLGLTYWTWLQNRLRRTFIPLIIAIITIIPMLAVWAIVRFFPPSPTLDLRGSGLMLLPFLFVSFLLVAWQYRWHYMVLIILGITGLNLLIIWSFSTPEPGPFRGALHVTLIQTIVFLVVGFAISYLMNKLREQQQSVEAANVRLTHYASTLEQLATSQERTRLARELHDTLAHTLSGLAVQLETVKAYWEVNLQTARSMLDKSLAAAHSGLEETRRALKALRASPLDELGLTQAISTIANDAAAHAKLTLSLSIKDSMPSLPPDVEQCLYRVAQEAITNVVNHANAKNLMVSLEPVDGKVRLTVRDDGIGFYVTENKEPAHFGLVGMRERAQLIGAELMITSKPGGGTTIQLTV